MDHQPDLEGVTGVKTNMDKANIEAREKVVPNTVNFVKQMCQEYEDKLVENSMSESEPRVKMKARRIYGVGSVQTKISCFLTVKGDILGGEGARVVDSDVLKGEKMLLRKRNLSGKTDSPQKRSRKAELF